tara:strand:- start:571 stop:900 length:330 start_codon:yes stop_codon:yes gene_type:complete
MTIGERMKSFLQYISEAASNENRYGKGLQQANPVSTRSMTQPSPPHMGDDSGRQVLFLTRHRRRPGDKLVDFGAGSFTHSYNTAGADAAQTRWRVSDGKRPKHLSKETS